MFERSWTVIIPGGIGPSVQVIDEIALPDGEPELELEAWLGGIAGANVFVFDGDLTIQQAQARIALGRFDCLLTVPQGGTARVRIPDNITQRLTVFTDTADTNDQAVTLVIRECRHELRDARTRHHDG